MTPTLRARAAHLARYPHLSSPRPPCSRAPRAETESPWRLDGQKMKGVADDGCAKCMFACFSCGTDWTFVVKLEGDLATFDQNKYCFGILYGSPCPCLNCCCCEGPHTFHWKLKKQSDNCMSATSRSRSGRRLLRAHVPQRGRQDGARERRVVLHARRQPDGAALPQAQADDALREGRRRAADGERDDGTRAPSADRASGTAQHAPTHAPTTD